MGRPGEEWREDAPSWEGRGRRGGRMPRPGEADEQLKSYRQKTAVLGHFLSSFWPFWPFWALGQAVPGGEGLTKSGFQGVFIEPYDIPHT
jgi:hypothetical protein